MADLPASLIKALDSLEKAAESKDSKNCALSLRLLHGLRSKINLSTLASLFKVCFNTEVRWAESQTAYTVQYKSAEVALYLSILSVMLLIKENRLREAEDITKGELQKSHSRNSQPLIAKLYYYLGYIYELKADLDVKEFLQYYRTSCLKHDTFSQAVLINVILRFYLITNKVRLAKEFSEKTGFPDTSGYPEIARNQFYLGKIKALTLNYTESHSHLVQAARKAPENGARGFKLAVEKLRILIELLMGTIPSRKSLLAMKGVIPYVDLIRAVRMGELEKFTEVLNSNKDIYIEDMNYSLVTRLRHIVIKSGLKRINLAYSAISLQDVAHKLGLKPQDTEFIVAKAIRDGVIEAFIDNESKELKSKTIEDVYTTNDPQTFLQKRIDFCIGLRNDTVKAMQFPQNKNNAEVKENNEDIDFDLLSDDDDF
jgi:26S proteasome regulatory subunit N3